VRRALQLFMAVNFILFLPCAAARVRLAGNEDNISFLSTAFRQQARAVFRQGNNFNKNLPHALNVP
jgi:hypothetical protein